MIGRLRGIILEKQPPALLLDVQGIGYEISAPMSTFYQLPDCGSESILFTHMIVREDAHQLYGFHTAAERELFRILLKVNGVGPRLALTILSHMSPDEFARCVASNDSDALVSLPGVGKKTAGRLIIDMRDRLSATLEGKSASGTVASSGPRASVLQDAMMALIALGYKSADASRAVSRVDDGVLASEDMIRRALQEGVG